MQRLICESDIRSDTPETITSTTELTITITPEHVEYDVSSDRQYGDPRMKDSGDKKGQLSQLSQPPPDEQDSRGRSMERKAGGEKFEGVSKISLMGFEGVVPRQKLDGKRRIRGRSVDDKML